MKRKRKINPNDKRLKINKKPFILKPDDDLIELNAKKIKIKSKEIHDPIPDSIPNQELIVKIPKKRGRKPKRRPAEVIENTKNEISNHNINNTINSAIDPNDTKNLNNTNVTNTTNTISTSNTTTNTNTTTNSTNIHIIKPVVHVGRKTLDYPIEDEFQKELRKEINSFINDFDQSNQRWSASNALGFDSSSLFSGDYTNSSSKITSLRQKHFFNPTSDEDSFWITDGIRIRSSYLPHFLLLDLKRKGIPPLRLISILKWLQFHVTGNLDVQCISIIVELIRFIELGENHIQFRYFDEDNILSQHLHESMIYFITRLRKRQVASSIPLAMRLSWILEWYGVENPIFANGGPLLSFLWSEAWNSWGWSTIVAPKKLLKHVLKWHENPFTKEDLIFRAVVSWCLVRVYLENKFEGDVIMREDIELKVGDFSSIILELTPIIMIQKSMLEFPLQSTKNDMFIEYEGRKIIEMPIKKVKKYFLDNFGSSIFFEQLDKNLLDSFNNELSFFSKTEIQEIHESIQTYCDARSKNIVSSFKLYGKKYSTDSRRRVTKDALKVKKKEVLISTKSDKLLFQSNQNCVDRIYTISPEMVSHHSLFLPSFTLAEQQWSLCLRESKTHLSIYLYNQGLFQGLPLPKNNDSQHKGKSQKKNGPQDLSNGTSSQLKLRVRISIVNQSKNISNRCLTFEQEWNDVAYGFDEFLPLNKMWDGDYVDPSGCIILALRVEMI